MKKTKKLIAVFLSVLTAIGLFAVTSFAAQETTEVKMLCYNVAGLPDFNGILGKENAKDVKDFQAQIGSQINSGSWDIVATQEDFSYHSSLIKPMTAFSFKTNHTGGVPGGDGMNVYSKRTIYNEKRTTWQKAFGIIDNGADEMTPKGILYTVLDLGNGILVDFYDLHADAFGDEGSVAARNDNMRQLVELIDSNKSGRPVIVTGDFNTSSHFDKTFTQTVIKDGGLKDAWTELYNGGNYDDYSSFYKLGSYWGVWDSVEKFLYKDGENVKINPEKFEYIDFKSADGQSLSDHCAASVSFSFAKDDSFSESTDGLSVTKENKLALFMTKIKYIFLDLKKIFSNIDELLGYIK